MNNWTCVGWLFNFVNKNGIPQYKRGTATPVTDIYVADVERYTMRLDHSVRSALGHRFYSSNMVGYLLDCSDDDSGDSKCVRRPLACDRAGCPDGSRRSANLTADEGSVVKSDRRSTALIQKKSAIHVNDFDEEDDGDMDEFAALQLKQRLGQSHAKGKYHDDLVSFDMQRPVSLAQGDMFSIGKLLQSANISLDKSHNPLPDWSIGSYRSSGLVIVIRIAYTNHEQWLGLKVLPWCVLGPPPRYSIRVTKHSSYEEFLLRKVRDGEPTDPKGTRILQEYRGIRILIEQSGGLIVWNNIQLLLILTTTLALMAVAACITDTVALYCLSKSDEYWAIKFERPRRKRSAKQDDASGHESPDDEIQRYSSMTM
eukprot:CAMPEP_0169185654 /NCGR_PEP_ID=MMETSP1016-20121227/1920_1 /TAXON_ID=342587 /ORGANISM="Karlodinium micrum, Strain CCMP2283" /LENGTH=369 /DNA_ID=CAMNT_0009261389 /DNA_START=392 /DNA_END=1501 /DNA_ORIENTATION=-